VILLKAGAKLGAGYGKFGLIDIEKPMLKKTDDVLFRVTSVGMCGTDLSIYKWTDTVAREYHPSFPLVIGHEMSGVVESIGSAVTSVKIGDHITVNEHIFCGKCDMCAAGMENICGDRKILGCHINGALTEYVVVREKNCFKLPGSMPYYAGAIAEPISVAIHATERVPVEQGDTAVIYGVGTIGLALCIVLVEMGVRVFAVGLESDKNRFAVAGEIGATPVNIERHDLREELKKHGRKWADIAYECSGSTKALQNALEIIKPAGRVCVIGIPGSDVPIDMGGEIVFREKSIIGVRAFYHNTWNKTMALLDRCGENAEKLITHKLPLREFERAFEFIAKGECIKTMIIP
jgi:threonine dehydrogenase-like Zn-dependent dehydrogenase